MKITILNLMLVVTTLLLGCAHTPPPTACLLGDWELQRVEGDFGNIKVAAHLRFDENGTYTGRLLSAEKNSKLTPVAEWSSHWVITNGVLKIDTASPFQKTNLVTKFKITGDALHFERDPLFPPWTSKSIYKRAAYESP